MTKSDTYIDDGSIQAKQVGKWTEVARDRNRAYVLIGLLLVLITGLSVAVVILAKVHQVIPVISVIDANGHVVKQQIVDQETIISQDSFVQSQVHDFIMYCNTFDPAWRQHHADLCRLHSTRQVAEQYDRETAADNPANPYYHLGQGGRRYPRITGITALGTDAYQVAFQSIVEKAGARPVTEYYTALVRFTFTRKPLALGDRWENALGFAATAYRKDQELSRQSPPQQAGQP